MKTPMPVIMKWISIHVIAAFEMLRIFFFVLFGTMTAFLWLGLNSYETLEASTRAASFATAFGFMIKLIVSVCGDGGWARRYRFRDRNRFGIYTLRATPSLTWLGVSMFLMILPAIA